jgi:predicted RNA binding protein YcfA (HicA-like mRNA interferase family)
MGRLAGFTHRETTQKLRRAGFEFDRSAKGSHEIWKNRGTGRRAIVPNHPGTIPEGTMRGMLQRAGLSVDEFLNL